MRNSWAIKGGWLGLVLSCAGCGQKGALYLPTPTRDTVPAATTAAPAETPTPATPTSGVPPVAPSDPTDDERRRTEGTAR